MANLVKSKSGNFAAQGLQFFAAKDDAYCRIELHQPCATGTLKEPLHVTTLKWLEELESGVRSARFAGNVRMIEVEGKLVSDGKFLSKKEKAK